MPLDHLFSSSILDMMPSVPILAGNFLEESGSVKTRSMLGGRGRPVERPSSGRGRVKIAKSMSIPPA